MKPLAPNTMIQNRYLVVQAIGKGGMGEVYLAVDQRLGSAVALKRTYFSDDSTLGSAFEREARILARLRHPVLPKVIDHFGENTDQYLVMEHISGDDLSKRLETANKPFPLSWVMFWADQMLDALSYLHSHEPPIIHRDIKPQNLKLTDENHIVILDFGLSKDFDSSTTGNPLNSASVAGYSPHFASMEQIRGTGTDPRSDLYSLSATLYQLLTNTIPVDALSRADAIIGGGKDPIVTLHEINPDISPAISEVILKGLELRQDQRFATAAEMQKALRRAFNQGNSPLDPKTLPLISEAPVAASSSSLPSVASENATISYAERSAQAEASELSTDSTLKMDTLSLIEEAKQAFIKTEVLLPVISSPDEETDEQLQLPKLTAPVESVSGEAEPIESAATVRATVPVSVPLQTTSEPTHGQELETQVRPPVPVVVETAALPPSHQSTQADPPRAKASKAGMIIGVLVGLLLIGGLAIGGGWYALTKFNAATPAEPPPAPSPSASPMPTVMVAADPNVNIESNTTANTAEVKDTNTDVTNTTRNPPTATAPAGTRSTTPSAPPTVTTKGTQPPRTAPPPAVKATPKPKQPDERTKILQ